MMNELIEKEKLYKININIKNVMNKKGVNRFKLSKETNTKMDTINRLYFNNSYKIDLDVLKRICLYLNCDISDILTLDRLKK